MSKQLTFSAALAVLAMTATVVGLSGTEPSGGGARGATAHGSVISVLLRA